MTGDFRRIVWTIAHLPASACTTSAPGSKSPLGRGGGGGAARIGVLPGFPVVGVRLCGPNAAKPKSTHGIVKSRPTKEQRDRSERNRLAALDRLAVTRASRP